jgi:hypothetical protein
MVDLWELEDGTKVYLGGKVEGDSFEARRLRSEFAEVRRGVNVGSGWGPLPSDEPLNLDTPHLLDSYLRDGYQLKSWPTVIYPKLTPPAESHPGRLY